MLLTAQCVSTHPQSARLQYSFGGNLQHPCAETMGTTEATVPDHNDFEYDEETVRTTGLVLAIVMFVAGILIALSNKCTKCVKSSSKSSDTQIPKKDVPTPAV